jgi:hypothetical protein
MQQAAQCSALGFQMVYDSTQPQMPTHLASLRVSSITNTWGDGGASDQPQKAQRHEKSPAAKPMALRIHTRCSPHSVSSTLSVLNTRLRLVRMWAICCSNRHNLEGKSLRRTGASRHTCRREDCCSGEPDGVAAGRLRWSAGARGEQAPGAGVAPGVGRRRTREAKAVGVGYPLRLAGRRVRPALEDAVGQLQRLCEAIPHHGLQYSRFCLTLRLVTKTSISMLGLYVWI